MHFLSFIALIVMPLLATGALHGHNHPEHHRRALVTEVTTITEVVTETVEIDPSSTSSTSSSAVTFSALPSSSLPEDAVNKIPAKPVTEQVPSATSSESAPTNTGNPFKELATEPHSVSVMNSCDYDIYISSIATSPCGPGAKCKLVPAGSTHTENMRICTDGGISLKISKTEDMSAPMQFEYTVWPNQEVVSYDISYLDCMKNGEGQQDLTACAGHDGGIQAVGGGDCKQFYCHASEWCDTHAYVVAEFGYKTNAPVGGCAPEEGISFELCAGNR